MKKKSNKTPLTTLELILHTPSPVAASLRNFRPQTVQLLKHKKKFKEAYKKDLRNNF